MLRMLTIALCLAGCARSAREGAAQAPAGEGRLEILPLESQVFGNRRELRIWLPPGYDAESNRDHRYPVLYLNDGQNLFDSATALFGAGEWKVDETITQLIRERLMEPIVVVGIDNAGRQGRAREYLPYPDRYLDPPVPDPQGKRYPEFLVREVLPLVEGRYRVGDDAEHRAFGGSSYGALIALHVAVARPGIFSRLLLESPSFYVDDRHVLRDAERSGLRARRVYLGVGTNELALDDCPDHPGNLEAIQGVRELADLLTRQGMREGEDLKVVVEKCAVHNEGAWARRFPDAVAFLFPPP